MQRETPQISLQKALVPVSKMVIQFGLHCHEFKQNIQLAYIQAAIELLNESGIKPTNQAIAVKTGIDRRAIAEFNKITKTPEKSMNKMDLVLEALQRLKNQGTTDLPASKLNQLIDNIYGGHIRAKAVVTELLSKEVISKINNKFHINQALYQQLSTQKDLADEVDVTTKRLFDTFYQKMYSQNQAEHLNLASVYSGRIPDSKHDKINQIIEEKMLAFQKEMQLLIEEHETNVKAGSFANVGFAQFQFDSRKQIKNNL
ncbi:hypothetical protein [Marinicella rhabdoformis]|uniref:hypothetical protein n=1 Tax=Marinicella rhabdoformis TaxID=2580566 RepID=UPI0012AED54A|nr:hypothetical protein [Marinicella rhabdoformis]